ncbi:terpene cyclase/mutase family protein [Streptomyces ficellus]|uniref:Terpene cyclase/mutase family protein n=1 Tax=Streptomyces ficellus TaxID=1977088 RepID=A0ABT7ZEH5_9ACTN|nr:prenyltransferase/squalene oxidase repeat-containing protein [Streptomyces ficellus]MDN3297863.1 terpene cyclase/mutase family protein [Streptomyces ficellus]
MTTVRLRRGATALAATAVLLSAGSPAAYAAPSPAPSPSVPVAGMYGTEDPTYDGVWRQSLAFMAQQVSGVEPAPKAVDWLLEQQCASGGFASFRPDPGKPCGPAATLDTNATAVAVQALSGVNKPEAAEAAEPGTDPVSKAMAAGAAWLKSVQNKDGGWSYHPGAPSDANSTSLVISALAATGHRPGDLRSSGGKTPYDALLGFAIPCDAEQGAGAFAYQPDKAGKLVANADATAAAVLAGLGKDLQTRGAKPDQKPTCETPAQQTAERAARNGAAYLATALAKNGHLDLPPMPGTEAGTGTVTGTGTQAGAPRPDVGNTADAVIALGAAGHIGAAAPAMAWLEKNATAWATENGPAAYAQLILAAHTVGADARDFGGVDLVQRLNATGPAPKSVPLAEEHQEDAAASDEPGFNVWLAVAIFLVAGTGIGFLLSGRKRNRQL